MAPRKAAARSPSPAPAARRTRSAVVTPAPPPRPTTPAKSPKAASPAPKKSPAKKSAKKASPKKASPKKPSPKKQAVKEESEEEEEESEEDATFYQLDSDDSDDDSDDDFDEEYNDFMQTLIEEALQDTYATRLALRVVYVQAFALGLFGLLRPELYNVSFGFNGDAFTTRIAAVSVLALGLILVAVARATGSTQKRSLQYFMVALLANLAVYVLNGLEKADKNKIYAGILVTLLNFGLSLWACYFYQPPMYEDEEIDSDLADTDSEDEEEEDE